MRPADSSNLKNLTILMSIPSLAVNFLFRENIIKNIDAVKIDMIIRRILKLIRSDFTKKRAMIAMKAIEIKPIVLSAMTAV